jgi:DNA-binding SARP family transcriptional activator
VRLIKQGRETASNGFLSQAAQNYSTAFELAAPGEPWEDLLKSRAGRAANGRMTELRNRAEEDHAELMIQLEQPAVAYLTQLTTEQPLRERRWGLLMTALYQTGRQSEALRAYTKARDILQQEIGVEPGPDLRELERQVLAHEELIVA